MHPIIRVLFVAGSLVALNGCAMLVGGIVGAAVTPIITPAVDRVMDSMGLDWFDPAGTSGVKPTAATDAK
jgi:hypothetical protein